MCLPERCAVEGSVPRGSEVRWWDRQQVGARAVLCFWSPGLFGSQSCQGLWEHICRQHLWSVAAPFSALSSWWPEPRGRPRQAHPCSRCSWALRVCMCKAAASLFLIHTVDILESYLLPWKNYFGGFLHGRKNDRQFP